MVGQRAAEGRCAAASAAAYRPGVGQRLDRAGIGDAHAARAAEAAPAANAEAGAAASAADRAGVGQHLDPAGVRHARAAVLPDGLAFRKPLPPLIVPVAWLVSDPIIAP